LADICLLGDRSDLRNDGMFGIDDPLVILGYLLCIASALLCVIYGLVTHNHNVDTPDADDSHWLEEEKKMEEELS
jgi:hypothetical protein